MSGVAFVILFLLTIPHVAEARASGTEAPIRSTLICENHTRSADARGCIDELGPQKQFDAAPVVTNPFRRER